MKVSEELNNILVASFNEAKTRTHEYVTPEHILYSSLFFLTGPDIIENLGGNIDSIKDRLEEFFNNNYIPVTNGKDPVQSEGFINLIENAMIHISSAGKDTLNVYSAIANNPEKEDLVTANFDASMKFIEFLVSDNVQSIFADFGTEDFGRPLFNPYIPILENEPGSDIVEWIQELAYFDGTECPVVYRHNAVDLYS